VGLFTNEEGARFAPDMLGSLVYAGGMPLDEALDVRAIDGARLGDELQRIGYAGTAVPGALRPHAFVELHIEQGPVLDAEGVTIGAVQDLQGISWQALTITGQSNHAGTTPMHLRHDAGYAAAAVATFVRDLTRRVGPPQVATVGRIELHPNLINVIAARATVTVDLRHTDEAALQRAEAEVADFLRRLAQEEGVTIESRRLARFEPVRFDEAVVRRIEDVARRLGHAPRRMTSGAGHDAQMLARVCPAAMIFVPSVRGISHNPAEHTAPEHLVAGADVLLHTMLELAGAVS
jgi:N-carbamoyl-L-amino-acid hydrolase